MSNARFPKKARKGKVIWKMDEDRQELEISQVDTQINEEAYENKTEQVLISDPSLFVHYRYVPNKELKKYCKTNG